MIEDGSKSGEAVSVVGPLRRAITPLAPRRPAGFSFPPSENGRHGPIRVRQALRNFTRFRV